MCQSLDRTTHRWNISSGPSAASAAWAFLTRPSRSGTRTGGAAKAGSGLGGAGGCPREALLQSRNPKSDAPQKFYSCPPHPKNRRKPEHFAKNSSSRHPLPVRAESQNQCVTEFVTLYRVE